nr:hypothetical protein BaRGS_023556 [Batillaria attramentaria]
MNQQLTEMSSQIQALKNVNLQQDQAIQDSQSSLYVRWGRSSCPASSQLVYSGVIGGSNYGDSGGATDYLCLSMSPVGGHIQRQSYHASLYGAELETYDNNANRDPAPTGTEDT